MTEKRPNIIFYFTDQQRSDTCGCYGQPLPITPYLDQLASEGVCFENAFSPQPVCGPCRAIFQTGKYATDTGCFRNSIALPQQVKTVANWLEEAGYQTAYIGKWHLASEGELEKKPHQDYQIAPIPLHLRGGYKGFWRTADVLEFTSDGYGGYVFDEDMNRRDFTGYRADCITDFALEFFDSTVKNSWEGTEGRPFFMTISHIEPHHQNGAHHYQGPEGSKADFADFVPPEDLKVLGGGDWQDEYPDYLGACASLDKNLGRLVARLKELGIYDNTVIIFAADHGSHFRTRNRDSKLRGYDDYKRTGHDSALKVPLVISGGSFSGNKGYRESQLVSTESLPKTIMALAGVDVGDAMIGENLLDVVEKKDDNRKNQVFAQISESKVGRCIRTAEYLYAVYAPDKDGGLDMNSSVYADDYLYHLPTDPHQLVDVVADPAHSQAKAQLRQSLLAWIQEAEGITATITD
ncbi:MAG: sulfatase-like hydrolase/transferase [Spirochaetaceae bacterium]|nr:sulfatase-like hydrolase/transferase [Spirochaetaceae bacterium]MBQ8561168.1 sulfatase-like hydrolase/transferase [Spirochaetaceae bacterium]